MCSTDEYSNNETNSQFQCNPSNTDEDVVNGNTLNLGKWQTLSSSNSIELDKMQPIKLKQLQIQLLLMVINKEQELHPSNHPNKNLGLPKATQ